MALAGGVQVDFVDGEPTTPKEEAGWLVQSSWNPDTDLADNYRLAIDCGIDIAFGEDGVLAKKPKLEKPVSEWIMKPEYFKDHGNDKEAATMKAINDCAIEIGKAMGGEG